ncbi:MAG: DEAD/DEAH box helicase [Candidatus ainarchaeum sp.]|nr:DEAD/DEAH box helicase [Candidatus ainarchaeum sp.]
MRFEDLNLSAKTLKSVSDLGYEEPTEVQAKAIPKIISGTNLIVRSQTGTGKTAAFGIGLIERIAAGTTSKALVLVPTRELALQVCEELRRLGLPHGLNVRAAFGGQKLEFQIRDLQRSYDILVATPGRLLDLCERGTVYLSKFNAVVLDEADHMLDIGFRWDVFKILDGLPPERLTLLFSATVDTEIREIASMYLPDSELIEVGEMRTVSSIKEERIDVPHAQKVAKLLETIKLHPGVKTLIFARTRRGVMRLKRRLEEENIPHIGMLHGDMEQPKRTRMIHRFKTDEIRVLVATNVAARGLHIDDVGLIINYDEAEDMRTHLHRAGRTGRMGAEGKVITFVSDDAPPPRQYGGQRRGQSYGSGSYSHGSGRSRSYGGHGGSWHGPGGSHGSRHSDSGSHGSGHGGSYGSGSSESSGQESPGYGGSGHRRGGRRHSRPKKPAWHRGHHRQR